MSITVAKILQLPSLRGATVVAGKNGLDRVINAVSVLEYAKPTSVQEHLFHSIEFPKGEIALTSFNAVATDVEAQCSNVRQLASVGQVGLIIYYVGIVMPKIDQRLIDCANELDFVLIQMPPNDATLRYSEAISDIMDAIFRDRESAPSLAIDVLDQMSRMPAQHRTVDTLLQFMSFTLRASIALTDESNSLLAAASWPSKRSLPWDSLFEVLRCGERIERFAPAEGEGPFWAQRSALHLEGNPNATLAVLSEHGEINSLQWEQALEGIRLGMNLWGREHNEIAHIELVRSIVQDEPIRMRRLGGIYGIDVSALSDVWFVHVHGDVEPTGHVAAVKQVAQRHANVALCEQYENNVLIFPIGTRSLAQVDALSHDLLAWCEEAGLDASVTVCAGLESTLNVKNAYRMNQDYVDYARTVFEHRRFFTLNDMTFVRLCKDTADAGEAQLERTLLPLRIIEKGHDASELIQTLATYLLDADQSVVATAECLFVHKNTVKYRLQKASDALGYRVGTMPSTHNLILALGIRRLLSA